MVASAGTALNAQDFLAKAESEEFLLDLSSFNEEPYFDLDPTELEWDLRTQQGELVVDILPSLRRPIEQTQDVNYTIGEPLPEGLDIRIEEGGTQIFLDASSVRPGDSYSINVVANDGGLKNAIFFNSFDLTVTLPELDSSSELFPDDLARAKPMTDSPNFEYNIGASSGRSQGEPSHEGVGPNQSIWFKWEPGVVGQAIVDTLGSSYDTVLSVYTAGGAEVNVEYSELTRVAGNANDFPAEQDGGVGASRVRFSIDDPAKVFWIAVDSGQGQFGLTQLNWQINQYPSVEVDSGNPIQVNARDGIMNFTWSVNDPDLDETQTVGFPFYMEVFRNGALEVVAYPQGLNLTQQANLEKVLQPESALWDKNFTEGFVWQSGKQNVDLIINENQQFNLEYRGDLPLGDQLFEVIVYDSSLGQGVGEFETEVFVPPPANDLLSDYWSFYQTSEQNLNEYPLKVSDLVEWSDLQATSPVPLTNNSAGHDEGELIFTRAANSSDGSVWIAWQAPFDGQSVFDLQGEGLISSVSVFKLSEQVDPSSVTFGDLELVVHATSLEPGDIAQAQFQAELGINYFIALDTFSGSGDFLFELSLRPSPYVEQWNLPIVTGETVVFPPDTASIDLEVEVDVVHPESAAVSSVQFFYGESGDRELIGAGELQTGAPRENTYSISWVEPPAGIFELYVRIEDSRGGVGWSRFAAMLQIEGQGAPEFVRVPDEQFLVDGQFVQLVFQAEGELPLNYSWDFEHSEGGPVTIPGIDNHQQSSFSFQFRPDYEGEITVQVSNSFGEATETVKLNHLLPPRIAVQPSPKRIKLGDSFILQVQAENAASEDLSFQWFRNGAPIEGENNSTLTKSAAQNSDFGYYSVAVRKAASGIGEFAETLSQQVEVRNIDNRNLLVPEDPVRNFWTTDGIVEHLAVESGHVIAAGRSINLVGPFSGSMAEVTTAGVGVSVIRSLSRIPKVTGGEVRVIEPDGRGGYFIGGSFNLVDGYSIPKLFRVLPNGEPDRNFNLELSESTVSTLEVVGDVLFIGGNISSVRRNPVKNFSGVTLDGEFIPEAAIAFNGEVNDILWEPESERLFISGGFTEATLPSSPEGTPPQRPSKIAAYQLNPDFEGTGFLVPDVSVRSGELDGIVQLLAMFTHPQSSDVIILAGMKLDKNTGVGLKSFKSDLESFALFYDQTNDSRTSEIVVSSAGAFLPTVNTVQVYGPHVYVGGSFGKFGNDSDPQINHLAELIWDTERSAMVYKSIYKGEELKVDDEIYDLVEIENSLYLGGRIGLRDLVRGEVVNLRNLIRIIHQSGGNAPGEIDFSWAPQPSKQVRVLSQGRNNNSVLLGGGFELINSTSSPKIASIDLETGKSVDNSKQFTQSLDLKDIEYITFLASHLGAVFLGVSDDNLANPRLLASPVDFSSYQVVMEDFWVQSMKVHPSGRYLVCAGVESKKEQGIKTPVILALDLNTYEKVWQLENPDNGNISFAASWDPSGTSYENSRIFYDIEFLPQLNIGAVVGRFIENESNRQGFLEFLFDPDDLEVNGFKEKSYSLNGPHYVSSLESQVLSAEKFYWVLAGKDFKEIWDKANTPYALNGLAVLERNREGVFLQTGLGANIESPSSIWLEPSELYFGGDKFLEPVNKRLGSASSDSFLQNFEWNPHLNWQVDKSGSVRHLDKSAGPLTIGGDFYFIQGIPHPYLGVFHSIGAPIIDKHPTNSSSTVAYGVDVSLKVGLANYEPDAPGIKYEWWKDGALLMDGNVVSGSSSSTLQLNSVTQQQTGSYRCRVSNDQGEAWSREFFLKVNVEFQITQDLPDEIQLIPDETLNLVVKVVPESPDLQYLWIKDGKRVAGAPNGNTLEIDSTTLADAGAYQVQITGFGRELISNQTDVRVITPGQALPLNERLAGSPIVNSSASLFQGTLLNPQTEFGEPNYRNRFGFRHDRSGWALWDPEGVGTGVVRASQAGGSAEVALVVYKLDEASEPVTFNQVETDDLAGFKDKVDESGFLEVKVPGIQEGTVLLIGALVRHGQGDLGVISVETSLSQDIYAPSIELLGVGKSFDRGSIARLTVVVSGLDPNKAEVIWRRKEDNSPQTNKRTVKSNGNRFEDVWEINPVTQERVGVYFAEVSHPDYSGVERSNEFEIEISEIVDGVSHEATTRDNQRDVVDDGSGGAASREFGSDGYPFLYLGHAGNQVLNNGGSTLEPIEITDLSTFGRGAASRWYKINTAAKGILKINTMGSQIRTIMSLFKLIPGGNTEFKFKDDGGAADGFASQIIYPVQANESYLVQFDGLGGQTGIIQLNWILGTQPDIGSVTLTEVILNEGEELSLSFPILSGSPDPDYRWFRDGIPIPFANDSELFIPVVSVSDSGIYQLEARNEFGSDLSILVEVTVIPNNALRIIQHPQGGTVTEGGDYVFTAQSIGGSGNIAIQWYSSEGPISGANSPDLVIENVDRSKVGAYYVEFRDLENDISVFSRQAFLELQIGLADPVVIVVRATSNGNELNLQVNGLTEGSWQLQSSRNLDDWTEVETFNTATEEPSRVLTVSIDSQLPGQEFYRIVSVE